MINLEKYQVVKWYPKKYKGLIDCENVAIRAFVSKDKILYSTRDLDRLRGLTSNSSNTTQRLLQKQDRFNKHIFKVFKKDFAKGTDIWYSFRSSQMTLIDDYLANIVMAQSNVENHDEILKIFRNGVQQKARIIQKRLKESGD